MNTVKSFGLSEGTLKRKGFLHRKLRKVRHEQAKGINRKVWIGQRVVSILLLLCIFVTTTFASPESVLTVVVSVGEFKEDIRFAMAARGIGTNLFSWDTLGFLFKASAKKAPPVVTVQILPGDQTVLQGNDIDFSAIGLDGSGNPLSGLKFNWTITDTGRNRPTRPTENGHFQSRIPGTFVLRAETGGRQGQVTVTVKENIGLGVIKHLNKADKDKTQQEKDLTKDVKAKGLYKSRDISTKGIYDPEEEKKPAINPTTAQNDKPAEQNSSESDSSLFDFGWSGFFSKKVSGPNEANPATERLSSMAPFRPANEDGWGNDNWWMVDDPGNQVGDPPGGSPDAGAGNGNFTMTVPVVALPGRGIDLNLNMYYNSRLWSKTGTIVSYDSDRGFPAPGWSLGFGKMVYMGSSGGCMIVDADGTRHGYNGTVSNYGTTYFTSTTAGHTTDGSFIDYGCSYSSSSWGIGMSGWARLPNGMVVEYNSSTANGDQAFPTRISDSQGNYITITYLNNRGPQIQTITDTMGRPVTFNYDTGGHLISVGVPKMDNAGTRIAISLHYKLASALNWGFSGLTADVANGSPDLIDAIYYPGTKTGYWFGDGDSYSSYGMIMKVIEQRNMDSTATTTAQGTVTPGTMTKQAKYDYPPAPNYSLTDAPTYSSNTTSWAGMDTTDPHVARYQISMNTSPRTITITQPNGFDSQPNGLRSKQYMYNAPGQWYDGLVYQDETIAPDNSILSKSVVEWEQGNYESPRPKHTEITDERNQTLVTDLEYGVSSTNNPTFNQVISKKEYDYKVGGVNGPLLRETRSAYENNPVYTNPYTHIFNLVKSNEVYDGVGNRVAKTDYEYDNNAVVNGTANHNLKPASGVIMHYSTFDPYTTDTVGGACINGQFNFPDCHADGEILWTNEGFGLICQFDCTEYEQVSAYNWSSLFRGNVTKETSYADATNLTQPIVNTKQYDITGNLVAESAACCELKTYDYTIATQFAYPTSASRGSSNINSSIRNTTSTTYDSYTGLVKTSTDPNGNTNSMTYDPNTLRPTISTSSTLAYTLFSYDDNAMTVTSETHEAGGNIAGRLTQNLNGLGKAKHEESLGADNVLDMVDTTYTNLGQVWKQRLPYRSGDTLQQKVYVYDVLGRIKQIIEPDGSVSQAFYNELSQPDSATSLQGQTVRVQDAWGRERWGKIDALGRLVELVEPNPGLNGAVSGSGSLITFYSYNVLDNLVQTSQGGQNRYFKYDSLGRMIRQKLAEQDATINDAGTYVGMNGPGALWSGAAFYDERSNIIQSVDARGVRTFFSYQSGGQDDPLNRLQSVTYNLTGPRDTTKPVAAVAQISYLYETTGDQERVKKATSGTIEENYFYVDQYSRLSSVVRTLADRPTYPMTTSYAYDSLNRIVETRYPEQYGIAGNPRKLVLTEFDSASRVKKLTVGGQQQAGTIVYNASSQITSVNIGAPGTNQVTEQYTFDPQTGLMTNQKAIRNGTPLMDLSYDYNRYSSSGTLTGKTGALSKMINNLNPNTNREYQYDAIGRLVTAKGGPTSTLWQQQYTYDRYGNRTNVTSTGNAANNTAIPRDGIENLSYSTVTNHTTSGNRIITAGWQYDFAGNLTRGLAEDGVSWLNYEYDAANRLVAIKQDNGTPIQSQEFGVGNDRISMTNHIANEKTYYAGNLEYKEVGNTGSLAWSKCSTYFGGRILSTATPNGSGGEITEFNHPDGLGTRLVTNQQTGTNFEQIVLPFGTKLDAESGGSTTKRFTSYERSTTPGVGLDYAQNRTYDSRQGRFTQVDPIGIAASTLANPQSLNLYSYCANDPINHTDPDGLSFLSAIGNFFKMLFGFAKRFKAVQAAIRVVKSIQSGNIIQAVKSAIEVAEFVAKLSGNRMFQAITGMLSLAVSFDRIRNSRPSIIVNLLGLPDPEQGADFPYDDFDRLAAELKRRLGLIRNGKKTCEQKINEVLKKIGTDKTYKDISEEYLGQTNGKKTVYTTDSAGSADYKKNTIRIEVRDKSDPYKIEGDAGNFLHELFHAAGGGTIWLGGANTGTSHGDIAKAIRKVEGKDFAKGKGPESTLKEWLGRYCNDKK